MAFAVQIFSEGFGQPIFNIFCYYKSTTLFFYNYEYPKKVYLLILLSSLNPIFFFNLVKKSQFSTLIDLNPGFGELWSMLE